MNDELDNIEWEEVFFDGDLFVDDQRDNERHGAQVELAFAAGDVRHKATSSDISDGGLFIVTDEILAPNTQFKLVFKLPTCEEPIRAIGRVAWIRPEAGDSPDEPAGFGVQFVNISEQARLNIEQFIELRAALLLGADDEG